MGRVAPRAFLAGEDGPERQADIYRRPCLGAGSTGSLFLKGGVEDADDLIADIEQALAQV